MSTISILASMPTFSYASIEVPLPIINNKYPMKTRSKDEIIKPSFKLLLSTITAPWESKSFYDTNKFKVWYNAMQVEYQALICNYTRKLVPKLLDKKLMCCDWVFKTKELAYKEIEKRKVCFVAEGYLQARSIDYKETFSSIVKACTIMVVFIFYCTL